MIDWLFGGKSKKEDAPFDPKKAIEAFIAAPPSGTSRWGLLNESDYYRRTPLEEAERKGAIAYFPHIGRCLIVWESATEEERLQTLEQIEGIRLPEEVDRSRPFRAFEYHPVVVAETEADAAATRSPTIVLEFGQKGPDDVINFFFGPGYNSPGIPFGNVKTAAELEVSRILIASRKKP